MTPTNSWPPARRRRPPRPGPERPVLPGQLEEFENQPWAPSSGEMLPASPPAPTPTESFVIPPPDWETEAGDTPDRPPLPKPDPRTAYEVMMQHEHELGVIDGPADLDLTPAFTALPPPPAPPEPDWRAEEAAARQAAAGRCPTCGADLHAQE